MREIAAISARLEEGASVTEVNAAYEAHEFPELERVESQMAMIKAVERVGKSAVVNQVKSAISTLDFILLLISRSNQCYMYV